MIRKQWWKILAVLLFLYSLLAGMIVPLSPASLKTDFSRANSGELIDFMVTGYNTHYTRSGTSIRAWLRDGDYSLCLDTVTVLSDNTLSISSRIPPRINDQDKVRSFSLVVDAGSDGYSVLPNAIPIAQQATRALTAETCPIENLNKGSHAFTFPFRNILEETIRNLYYHVPLWFGMILIFLGSMIYSIKYLIKSDLRNYVHASELARVGVVFGILGLLTGAIWAKHTWGAYWSWDVRQNTAAISMLIYMAYFVLKESFEDYDQKARISSIYNIFAFASLIPLMFIIPRVADSLHPGAGGNPAFGSNDLDNTMRLVFYPAVIAFTMLGYWLSSILIRIKLIDYHRKELIES